MAEELISPNEKAEIELLRILDNMRNGNNDRALLIAEKLTKDFPNFKLGKIIYADLLSSYLQKKPLLSSKSKDKELNDTVVFILTTSNEDNDRTRAYHNNVAGYMVKHAIGPQFAKLATLMDAYIHAVELE